MFALRSACAAPADEPAIPDCAVNALYVLFELEGRAVTVEQIEHALPYPDPRGYSMADLITAADKLGLGLEGVRFTESNTPLSRPAIVFFQSEKGGHFAVLRPVGTTGTMVQLIDPPDPPAIVDYGGLFTDPAWTGRLLIASKPWFLRWGLAGLAAVSAAGLLVFGLWRGRRDAERRRTDQPHDGESPSGR